MTNAELIDKIKAEIERLHAQHSSKYGTDEAGLVLERLEDFLSTIESEKPMDLEERICSYDIVPYIDDKIAKLQDMWREEKVAFDWDDMHEMIEDVARHFYDLGCCRTAEKADEIEYNRQRFVVEMPNNPGDKVRIIILPKEAE